MGLQGNLEDLPLLDIIQIVSFSKKTGYLAIEMEEGDGAIVFQEGLVVAAFAAGMPALDPRVASLGPETRTKVVRGRIAQALERLARLHEGGFSFELTEDVPVRVGSRELAAETLSPGINPQEMLLELAQGIDEDRASSTAAVEASFDTTFDTTFDTPEATIVPAEATRVDFSEAEAEAAREARERARLESMESTPPPAIASSVPPPVEPVLPPVAVRPPAAPAGPAPPRPGPVEAPPTAAAPPTERPPAEPPLRTEAPAEPVARTLLLVDDEADVRGILARVFSARGYQVEQAGDPEEAAKAAGRLREASAPFVLVTDLGMPATGGASFHGGFEVVKRLWKMNLRPPVLMMTESLSQSLKLRARQMGVQSFVFKPTLSKLNPRQFEADLCDFAARVVQDLLPRLSEVAVLKKVPRPAAAPRRSAEGAVAARSASHEYLRHRLLELRQRGDANQIATLVMKVAREFFERALLMVVKNDEARGLGGFGLAPREETLNLAARQVTVPLAEPSVFKQVAESRRPFAGRLPADRWSGHVLQRIGRFQSGEVAVLPLVAHRETIALLVGDNPESGRPVDGLEDLELFIDQAGVALENVFLQKKLQALEERNGRV